jgi:WD40 repeat protein
MKGSPGRGAKRLRPQVMALECRALLSTVPVPVFGTGSAGGGTLLSGGSIDPHYRLVANPDPALPGPNAYVLNPGPPIAPNGPWVANGPLSEWISAQPANPALAAPGTYRDEATFDLTGLDPATARLSGQWAAAGLGANVLLNGNPLGLTSPGPNTLSPVAINGGFLLGLNTLDFVVVNPGPANSPTGLRVDLAGVANAVPVLTALNVSPATIHENDPTTLSGGFTELGTPEAHMVMIDWGAGQTPTTLTLAAGVTTFSAAHTYLNNLPADAPYGVTVTVADGSGESATGTASVTVHNVAPANLVVTASPATIPVGGTTSLSGSFTDPGTLDAHTVTVDWGDSSPVTTVALAAGALTFSGVNHQYQTAGVFPINLLLTDEDGAAATGGARVNVQVVKAQALVTKVELDTGGIKSQLPLPGTFVKAYLSPDGSEKVFLSVKDGVTYLTKVEVKTGQQKWQQTVSGTVVDAAFSPDSSTFLVTTSDGGTTRVNGYDAKTGAPKNGGQPVTITGTFIQDFFSADGTEEFVVTMLSTRRILVTKLDVKSGARLADKPVDGPFLDDQVAPNTDAIFIKTRLPGHKVLVTRLRYDPATRRLEAKEETVDGDYLKEVLSPDGTSIFVLTRVGNSVHTTRIDVATGAASDPVSTRGALADSFFSADGKELFIITTGRDEERRPFTNITKIDVATGKEVRTDTSDGRFVEQEVSQDGKRLVVVSVTFDRRTGAATTVVTTINIADGTVVGRQTIPGEFAKGAFTPDGKFKLIATQGNVAAIDLGTGKQFGYGFVTVGTTVDLEVSPDGKSVVVITRIGGTTAIHVFDLGPNGLSLRKGFPRSVGGAFKQGVFAGDGETKLITTTTNGQTRLTGVNVNTGLVQSTNLVGTFVKQVFSPDPGQKYVFVITQDSTGAVFVSKVLVATGEQVGLATTRGDVVDTRFSADGTELFVTTVAKDPLTGKAVTIVEKIDVATGNVVRQTDFPGTFQSAVYSPDGKRLYVITTDGNDTVIAAVDVATGQAIGDPIILAGQALRDEEILDGGHELYVVTQG